MNKLIIHFTKFFRMIFCRILSTNGMTLDFLTNHWWRCLRKKLTSLYLYWYFHGLRTPNETFFHQNPKLLGLGRKIGQINWTFGIFLANLSAPILSMFSINQPLFLKKHKYLFGIGIWTWIWSADNLGCSHHVSVISGYF